MKRLFDFAYLWLAVLLALGGSTPLSAQPYRPAVLPAPTALSQYLHDSWSVDEGLPQNTVVAMAQTADGYLWVGTQEGLARFDGQHFTRFDETDSEVLSEGAPIKVLLPVPDGALWIGTRTDGLLKLKGSRIQRFGAEQGLNGQQIAALLHDATGTLWVGTYDQGLFYGTDAGFEPYTTVPALAQRQITALVQDRHGALWVGTDEGLFHLHDDETTLYSTAEGLADNFIRQLYEDRAGRLWVSTQAGLHLIEGGRLQPRAALGALADLVVFAFQEDAGGALWLGTDSEGLVRVQSGKTDFFGAKDGLAHSRIRALLEDREGSLWIGTEGGGLSRLRQGKVIAVTEEEHLPTNMVLTVYEDRQGALWAGTEGGGLVRYAQGDVTTYTTQTGLLSDVVLSIQEDAEGGLWVGTYGGGVSRLDNGRFQHFTAANGFLSDAVFALHRGRSGALWMGTNAGLARYEAGAFSYYTTDDGLSSNSITALYESRDGALWVGTYEGGLNWLKDGAFAHYGQEDGLPFDLVSALHEDETGTLWIGTYGGGLSRFKDGAFFNFSVRDGLLSNTILQILADEAGALWFSTNKGIFSASYQALNAYAEGRAATLAVNAFSKEDGLHSIEMNGGVQPAGWKGRDGTLWFPSTAGLVGLHPDNLTRNEVPPPVSIETVIIDGESVRAGHEVVAAPGKKKLEFHYAALTFIAPEKVVYRTRLEGYDEDWVEAGPSRTATFTNLPPGRYTFHVMARNSDGVWSTQVAAVSLYLKPFFYQTWWFLALCVLGLILLTFGLFRLRVQQLKARERELARTVEERTRDLQRAKDFIEEQADQLRELDRIKTRFFNNLSHEFRTPLTLTIGPLESALGGAYGSINGTLRPQLEIMLRNARRLLRLINQLLDLAKIESGGFQLRARPRNLVPLLEGVVLSFAAFAEERRLDLAFHPESDEVTLYYDPNHLEKIFFNLLSNAVKFTPEGGRIDVALALRTAEDNGTTVQQAEVRVTDTGCGIPAADLPYIFDRFRQVDGTVSQVQEGTGIGLSLAKELVELHGGRIAVESEQEVGTTFIVTLRCGSDHLAPEQMLGDSEPGEDAFDDLPDEASMLLDGALVEMVVVDPDALDGAVREAETRAPEDAPTILVVDDNRDIREYVRSTLHARYHVVEATDGEDGLAKARQHRPDLVLSDVMMPKMDGYAFCRAVREDPDLSHLPLILLTAKASVEMKVEGLETGADDYMAKPFNARELHARIRNLLQLREQEKQLKTLNSELTDFNAHLEEKVQQQLDLILTERRAYEEKLITAKERAEESARLKASILTNMSHEIRTPISAILGSAQILAGELSEEHREFVEYIEHNGKRLLETISSILELSRMESETSRLNLQAVDVAEAVRDVTAILAPMAQKKSLSLRTKVPTQPVVAELDAEALNRILHNLVGNALKFTNAGEVGVEVAATATAVTLRVRDTGVGISKEFLPELFEAFKQESGGLDRSHEGSGLGLALTKRLVEALEGTIEVESKKGVGTTFTVQFPRQQIPAPPALRGGLRASA